MNFNLQEALNKLTGKLTGWVEALVTMLPNFVVAVVILILFVIAAKWIRRLTRNLLSRTSSMASINDLLANIVHFSVISLGVFVALGIIQLDGTVKSLLAGAGIVGLALGFAFQDIAANFISGILMAVRQPFELGDIVGSNDFMGTVHQITLRTTIIHTFQGQEVIIPNKEVFQNPLVNYTKLGGRRIDLSVGVSYGDDLEKVRRVTIEAIEALNFLQKGKNIELFYKEFGSSSINFDVRYWVDFAKQTDYLKALSEGIIAIQKAYNANDIMIPFPIRTLDFGIKGGETLREMLEQQENGSLN